MGHTNSFTPATSLKLRLERVALIGGRGPSHIQLTMKLAVFTLKLGVFYWFVLVLTQTGVFLLIY